MVSWCLITWWVCEKSHHPNCILQVKGFEYIRGVHLEAQPFDVERDLTTPTFKLKRPQLLKYYQVKIAFETPLLFFFFLYCYDQFYHSFRHLGIFYCIVFLVPFISSSHKVSNSVALFYALQKEVDALYASVKKQWASSLIECEVLFQKLFTRGWVKVGQVLGQIFSEADVDQRGPSTHRCTPHVMDGGWTETKVSSVTCSPQWVQLSLVAGFVFWPTFLL